MTDCSTEPRPGEGRPAYAWYVVVVLMVAAALSLVDRLLIAQLVEPIKRDLQISDFQVSLLQGLAFSLTFAIAGIPIGRLVDRSVRRTIIAAGITFWSLMTAAGGFATSYLQLFLARAGVGIGEAALGPAAYSIISDYFSKSRLPLAISIFVLGTAVGSGLSFVVGGLISHIASQPEVAVPAIGTMRGWQAAFMLVGLPGVLLAALIMTLREPRRRGVLTSGRPATVAEVAGFLRERSRLAWCFVIGIGAAFTVTYALLGWLTSYFIRVHGASPRDVGALLGAVILTMSTVGIVAGGMISSRLLRLGIKDATLRTSLIGMALAVPLLIAAPLMNSVMLSVALFAPAILLSSIFISLGTSTIQLVTPNEMRGQVSALGLMLTTVLGSVLGPSLVALCSDHLFADEKSIGLSLSLVCGAMGLCATIALALALRPLREAVTAANAWSSSDDTV
ncbi:spinster family MFS transporter [Piscinibacter sakaiensis]|uniref:spinster family MFS transporter n=1 Tax=Piscinibacter sakaiensis TaxID=1547922 RepID=UPI003AABA01E